MGFPPIINNFRIWTGSQRDQKMSSLKFLQSPCSKSLSGFGDFVCFPFRFFVVVVHLFLLLIWLLGEVHNEKTCCLVTKSCPTLCNSMGCSMLGFPVLHYLLEFAQTSVFWVDDAIQPSHPLSPLLLLPSIFPSIRVFSSELALCIRWLMYWSFSFSISPSNEYSGLISFRIDWIDLLAVQGILKSLLQLPRFENISSSALSLLHSPTLTSVHDYWKNHSFGYMDLVSKVMSLFFSMLSRFVITFLQGARVF